ncbi:MAG TPA: PepSY-associated TM helix domain-containing protein [Gemmatimonadaceae bacterium]|nr:PepSY-associated TM helix domain-containing protein [Gemmatimonadaceae bacterium]
MPRPSVRRVSVLLHRWVGLVLGLLLAVLGLSGSALVFRQEIDRALDPELQRVEVRETRQPLAAVVAAARAAHPEGTPWRVRMPRRADGPVEVWMGAKPDLFVYVDPYTARVLGARRPTEFLTGWLFELHAHLLAGKTGELVGGIGALALVALSLSGMVAWWPGRGKLKPALTVARGRGGRRLAFDTHRAGGFYASALLFVAGVTGASLVFHEPFQVALNRVFRSPAVPPAPTAASSPTRPALPLDSALALAERVAPGGYVSYVYVPVKATDPVTVRKRRPGELHPNGKTFVYADPRDNALLGMVDGPTSPMGARAYSALYPLHIGVAGGLPLRLAMALAGLAPAALFVTGVVMWRGRGRGRRRDDARRPARAVRERGAPARRSAAAPARTRAPARASGGR